MSNYNIGTIPIPVIEEVQISSSVEEEEIDLIGKDSNIIVNGSSQSKDINIDFILVDFESLSTDLSVEELRKEIKKLPRQISENNDFVYSGEVGRISVENVNIPENPPNNIVEGSLEGKFLPWPKFFPDDEPAKFKFMVGEYGMDTEFEGEVNRIRGFEGDFILNTSFEGELEAVESLIHNTRFGGMFSTTRFGGV